MLAIVFGGDGSFLWPGGMMGGPLPSVEAACLDANAEGFVVIPAPQPGAGCRGEDE